MTKFDKARLSAERIEALHREWKAFHGARWEERYQEMAAPMAEMMTQKGITNPIGFVIPIVKLMQAEGRADAGMWFAVAAETAFRQKEKEGLRA